MSKSLKDLVLGKRKAESHLANKKPGETSWVKISEIEREKSEKYLLQQSIVQKQKQEKEIQRLKQVDEFYKGPQKKLKSNEQEDKMNKQDEGQKEG